MPMAADWRMNIMSESKTMTALAIYRRMGVPEDGGVEATLAELGAA